MALMKPTTKNVHTNDENDPHFKSLEVQKTNMSQHDQASIQKDQNHEECVEEQDEDEDDEDEAWSSPFCFDSTPKTGIKQQDASQHSLSTTSTSSPSSSSSSCASLDLSSSSSSSSPNAKKNHPNSKHEPSLASRNMVVARKKFSKESSNTCYVKRKDGSEGGESHDVICLLSSSSESDSCHDDDSASLDASEDQDHKKNNNKNKSSKTKRQPTRDGERFSFTKIKCKQKKQPHVHSEPWKSGTMDSLTGSRTQQGTTQTQRKKTKKQKMGQVEKESSCSTKIVIPKGGDKVSKSQQNGATGRDVKSPLEVKQDTQEKVPCGLTRSLERRHERRDISRKKVYSNDKEYETGLHDNENNNDNGVPFAAMTSNPNRMALVAQQDKESRPAETEGHDVKNHHIDNNVDKTDMDSHDHSVALTIHDSDNCASPVKKRSRHATGLVKEQHSGAAGQNDKHGYKDDAVHEEREDDCLESVVNDAAEEDVESYSNDAVPFHAESEAEDDVEDATNAVGGVDWSDADDEVLPFMNNEDDVDFSDGENQNVNDDYSASSSANRDDNGDGKDDSEVTNDRFKKDQMQEHTTKEMQKDHLAKTDVAREQEMHLLSAPQNQTSTQAQHQAQAQEVRLPPLPTDTDASLLSSTYECIVCGASLARVRTVRGRLMHIKKCGKRHGVTAGVVHEKDDEDDAPGVSKARCFDSAFGSVGKGGNDDGIVVLAPASDDDNEKEGFARAVSNKKDKRLEGKHGGRSSCFSKTPQSEWHDGTEVDLKLSEHGAGGEVPTDTPSWPIQAHKEETQPSSTTNAEETTAKNAKQSVMTNFFQMPKRSLNNVLLAGARRMAKKAEVTTSRGDKKAVSQERQQRGRYAGRAGGRNFGKKRGRIDYSKSACPSYKWITGTDFICDGFYYAHASRTTTYFLSHFHSDHYGGITSNWNAGIIYCSLPTANLVHQQLGVKKEYLHPLGLLTPTVITSKRGGKAVTVTLLDANHCPVMFLFEIGQKKVLHVGDFRWNRGCMLGNGSPLRSFSSGNARLDELFLDTTYCNEKYVLPTQDEAIDAAFDVVQSVLADHGAKNKKTLVLFGSYTIGKERIYLSIAQRLGRRVYVDSRRYRILSALHWPAERMRLLTTNASETSIWVVPLGHINFKRMKQYLEEYSTKAFSRGYDHVVGFRPTGWTFSASNTPSGEKGCNAPGRGLVSGKTNGKCSVYGVPYSEHSSFSELVDCLVCLRPKKITPTVSVSKSDDQVNLLLSKVRNIESAAL